MVLIGFLMHPPTPLASCPNLFAEDRLHASRYLVLCISWQQFNSFPVSVSITAIVWWTSFSNCVILHVRRIIPRRWHFCLITATANPGVVLGRCVGGWVLGRVCACVLMAGGAALATAIATCARVLICGLMPVVLVLLHSHAMHCFWRRTHLANVVSTLVGLEVGSGVGALIGIVVKLLIVLLVTLLIALVICWLSAVVGGTLGSACTLRSSGTLWAWFSALLLLMGASFLCSAARVAFTVRWRSFASCAVVPPVAHVIVLMHSANACITLSAWVMVGFVMFLCLKWTVSEWRSLLVALT